MDAQRATFAGTPQLKAVAAQVNTNTAALTHGMAAIIGPLERPTAVRTSVRAGRARPSGTKLGVLTGALEGQDGCAQPAMLSVPA